MKKHFTKIICVIVAVIAALGITVLSACSSFYSFNALSGNYHDGDVESNGGFVVKKGEYIYFLNGVEDKSADNKFGRPVKGAIYRISSADFAARKYSSAERVVPLVAYTTDYDAGLFIYGDYIYYGTPSTAKNSDGEVLNDMLDMKSSRLDGSETLKEAYVQFPVGSYQYRFVEVNGTVYLMYVAEDEKAFDESAGVKNLHSYNTATGDDTVLAYGVDEVIFDETDKTNPRVYYTMNVKNYATGSNYGYNQVYTVTADATKAKEIDTSEILGWNDDEDSEEEIDRYINCGSLVFDGIGTTDKATPFNFDPTGKTVNYMSYTYALKKYQGKTLFYTRMNSSDDDYARFFSVKDGEATAEGHNPVNGNADNDDCILTDGSVAENYRYVFKDGELELVLIDEGNGVAVNKYVNGKLQKGLADNTESYFLIEDRSATMLFVDGSYLYYSVTGGNGYTVNRINFRGAKSDYRLMPEEGEVGEFTPVNVLDLDVCSEWFVPELIDNQLVFASETTNMSEFNYTMVCDLRKDGKLMTNAQISELNDKYDGIAKVIDEFSNSEKYDQTTYANLASALEYAFNTGESADVYLKGLAEACNEAALQEDENASAVYSEATLEKYAQFLAPKADNEWKDYTETRKVNDKDVYANSRNYYYAVLGEMTEEDAEAFIDALRTTLQPMPEDDAAWWEGLSAGAKAGFIIGMCAIGLLVIGGAVAVVVVLRRKNNKTPERRRRVKVDTTDDKNIDVYGE